MKRNITVKNVRMIYARGEDDIAALDDVSFEVRENEFVSVVGATGCGKSTLLKIIGGLLCPTSGEVLIDGSSPQAALKRHRLGFVFQETSLLPWRTVYENIKLPAEINKVPASGDTKILNDLMDLVGLAKYGHLYPSELSGGMRAVVSIARTFSVSPKILLMDEPFCHLDEITRRRINELLLELWESKKTTTVFVTHNISEAVYLSDRVIVLTKAPAKMRKIVDIDFPRPRAHSLRSTIEFLRKTEEIFDLLSVDKAYEFQDMGQNIDPSERL